MKSQSTALSTPDSLQLAPAGHLSGDVHIPGSKSISNRALLLAALASGETRLTNLLDADDIRYMRRALSSLGIVSEDRGQTVCLQGRGGPLVSEPGTWDLDLGLAGTALRPLTAALTLGRGEFRIDGTARMRERPVGPLVDSLQQLGADITYLGTPGYPPLQVRGTGLEGGSITMAGDLSSQFLTSLLMAAPLARGPVRIGIQGEQVSKPYLAITIAMMRSFGAVVEHDDFETFAVTPGTYRTPGDFLVESDASSASYFLAAGAIAGPGLTVHGIGSDSVQGDVAFVEVLKAMGADVRVSSSSVRVSPAAALQPFDLDLNAIPDAAMTAAVLALFAQGTSTIRNIFNWRVKETDRLLAMATELRKVGAGVIEGRDFISITPPERLTAATIDTYGDHRMAMCFALVCLGGVPVTIRDPGCVDKTFPTFFELFSRHLTLR